ncbi:unnamed protein product [Auanema sp. JU1783]|nr:unnamed protein product [Auanema sp. JU1783]
MDQEETFVDPYGDEAEKEYLVWKKPEQVNNETLDDYLTYCRTRLMSVDRALYILMKCDYDVTKAFKEVNSRVVLHERWTRDDALLFRQAYFLHGKNFKKIQLMLPHHSICSLVDHYYRSKKVMKQSSYLDKLSIALNEEEDKYITIAGFNRGIFDAVNVEMMKKFIKTFQEGLCNNCGHIVSTSTTYCESRLCYSCYCYKEKFDRMRPTDYVRTISDEIRVFDYILPIEFSDLLDKFDDLCCSDETSKTSEIGDTDVEVVFMNMSKTRVMTHEVTAQTSEGMLKCQRREDKLKCFSTAYQNSQSSILANATKSAEVYRSVIKEKMYKKEKFKITSSWGERDRFYSFYCLCRYDLDFEVSAEVVGTKTPDMLKAFYRENQERIDKYIQQKNDIKVKRNEAQPESIGDFLGGVVTLEEED